MNNKIDENKENIFTIMSELSNSSMRIAISSMFVDIGSICKWSQNKQQK